MRAAALCICLSGFSASSASATTYDYVGNELNVSLPCCSLAPGLTGSVTFDFNTFDFSGTVYVSSGQVTALQLGGGSLGNYVQHSYFVLDNGAITSWLLQSFIAGWHSLGDGGSSSGDYVELGGGCFPICYLASNRAPGVWTPVDLTAPVPSPMVGAGLPGLAMAIAGFIGWRRSRRLAASRG